MTTRKRGRPKSQDKLNQILESAVELFLSEGYERTSMQRIAENASVSKQTLYSHFSNKEDLFRSCLEQKTVHNAEEYDKFKSLDLIDGLKAMSMHYLSLLAEPQVISIWRLMISSAEKEPKLSKMFFDTGPVETRKVFSKFLSQFPKELNSNDFDDMARSYISILSGARLYQLLLSAPVNTKKAANKRQAEKSVEMFKTLFMR